MSSHSDVVCNTECIWLADPNAQQPAANTSIEAPSDCRRGPAVSSSSSLAARWGSCGDPAIASKSERGFLLSFMAGVLAAGHRLSAFTSEHLLRRCRQNPTVRPATPRAIATKPRVRRAPAPPLPGPGNAVDCAPPSTDEASVDDLLSPNAPFDCSARVRANRAPRTVNDRRTRIERVVSDMCESFRGARHLRANREPLPTPTYSASVIGTPKNSGRAEGVHPSVGKGKNLPDRCDGQHASRVWRRSEGARPVEIPAGKRGKRETE